jgi:hypothetical protein
LLAIFTPTPWAKRGEVGAKRSARHVTHYTDERHFRPPFLACLSYIWEVKPRTAQISRNITRSRIRIQHHCCLSLFIAICTQKIRRLCSLPQPTKGWLAGIRPASNSGRRPPQAPRAANITPRNWSEDGWRVGWGSFQTE